MIVMSSVAAWSSHISGMFYLSCFSLQIFNFSFQSFSVFFILVSVSINENHTGITQLSEKISISQCDDTVTLLIQSVEL